MQIRNSSTGQIDLFPLAPVSNAQGLFNLLEQFEAYKKWLRRQPLSPNTKRAYETRLQLFLGFLGGRLDERSVGLTDRVARDSAVSDYKQYLSLTIESSQQTVNAYLTAIDSFFAFLGLGKCNAGREKCPAAAPQSLGLDEQKEFLQAVVSCKRPRDRALAILLLSTGIRISECKNLNLDDVRLSKRGNVLKVRCGNRSGYRELPLNPSCATSLQEWLSERKTRFPMARDEGLFLSNRGGRMSVDSIDHAVRNLAERANLHGVSSHTLRQTCLTNLLRQGNELGLVAQFGGHVKLETTKRYVEHL